MAKIIIAVEDNGCGFDASKLGLPSATNGGFGLFNIKERLEYIDGHLDIDSEAGRGTRVVMTVPAKKQDNPAANSSQTPVIKTRR